MKRTPLVRRKTLRRTPMKRGKSRSRYAQRPRDRVFMMFAKSLLCSVEEEWPNKSTTPTPCKGEVQADHMGERGLGRKADDRTCAPMCRDHHRERTDHTGTFKHVDRETERGWRARAIARTQTLFAERPGTSLA